jgi:hypothetical protein
MAVTVAADRIRNSVSSDITALLFVYPSKYFDYSKPSPA